MYEALFRLYCFYAIVASGGVLFSNLLKKIE